MGFHSRYAWPLLILLAVSFSANSAVRVQSNATVKQTRQSVVENGSTVQPAGFQTPNGEAAFFGQEHVDYHTAGNRFQAGDSPGTQTPPPKSVKVKPVAYANKAKVASKAATIARASVPGLALMVASEGFLWAIDQIPVPKAKVDDQGQLVRDPVVTTSKTFWYANFGTANSWSTTPQESCKLAGGSNPGTEYVVFKNATHDPIDGSEDFVGCNIKTYYPIRYTYLGTIFKTTLNCPNGFIGSGTTCSQTPPVAQPFTESDYAALAAALASIQNSEWLRDIMRRSCQGSSSPAACYDDLTQWGTLTGPASQTDSPVTKTTSTTYPDGTTSTTATTTQNTYNYNYSPTFFDVTTTTVTTTNVDGDVTTTTTTDQQPETETPSETEQQPEEEEDEQDYQFTDSDLPEIEPFYEQQYPGGLSGVWETRKAEIDNSPFLDFLQSFVPSFSGTCPTFGLDFNMGQWLSAGHIDFMSLCFVFDFIKIILLVSAVFLARSLVFGG